MNFEDIEYDQMKLSYENFYASSLPLFSGGVAFNEEGRYDEGGAWLKMLYGAFSVPL